jgi:hypothetical protein
MDNKHCMDNKRRRESAFENDRRRRRHHWAVTIEYRDGKQFRRIYTNEENARGFAARQKKSPVVGKATVRLIS